MRYALLIGRRHGEKTLQALSAPGEPGEVNGEFKRLLGAPGDLAELQLLVSDQGVTRRKKFISASPEVPAAPAVHKTPAPEVGIDTGAESGVDAADGPSLAPPATDAARPRRR